MTRRELNHRLDAAGCFGMLCRVALAFATWPALIAGWAIFGDEP